MALMGNLDLDSGHMSTEGPLAFYYNDCHAYSMRGSIRPLEELERSFSPFRPGGTRGAQNPHTVGLKAREVGKT